MLEVVMRFILRRPLVFAAGVVILAMGVNTARLTLERNAALSELASVKTQFAEHRAAAAEAAAEAERRNRRTEERWADRLDQTRRDHAKELERQARASADLRRTASELRDAATAFATGLGAAEDSLGACRERAATLGELFGLADEAAGRMAEAADRHSAEVRLLLDAWPSGG